MNTVFPGPAGPALQTPSYLEFSKPMKEAKRETMCQATDLTKEKNGFRKTLVIGHTFAEERHFPSIVVESNKLPATVSPTCKANIGMHVTQKQAASSPGTASWASSPACAQNREKSPARNGPTHHVVIFAILVQLVFGPNAIATLPLPDCSNC